LPATVSKWLHQPFPTTIFLCTFEVTQPQSLYEEQSSHIVFRWI